MEMFGMHNSVLFVGGGHMASAVVDGLLARGWPPGTLWVVETHAERRAWLVEHKGFQVLASVDDGRGAFDTIVWAVKPQDLRRAMDGMRHDPRVARALHLSIAAGVDTATLRANAGSARIVRAMPNLAAVVGASFTGLFAPPGLDPRDRALAEAILASVGKVHWVEAESELDMLTAVAGSGPGFVYAFLEALQHSAERLGLGSSVAYEAVRQTALGAALLAQADSAAFETLRTRVASRGGTTAAGLAALEEGGFDRLIDQAVVAAHARAAQLRRAG